MKEPEPSALTAGLRFATITCWLWVMLLLTTAAHSQSFLDNLQNKLQNLPSQIQQQLHVSPTISNLIQPLANQGQEAVLQQAYGAVGKALGDDLPVTLDARTAFASVTPPADFRPTIIECTPSNRNMPLPPGDYACEVRAYCMMDSVHRPGNGIPYEFAPLQGKQAVAIGALMNRGAAAGTPPSTLQVISWSIQAAIPLAQMPPQYQQVVHQLIPEYERGLQGDYLQQVEATYSRFATVGHLPPFDSQLDRMGQAGRTIQNIRRSREIIRQNALNYDRLNQRLYDGPPGQEVVRPANPIPSPWSQIRPGVIAQFVVEQGTFGLNWLNFRVLQGRQKRFGLNEDSQFMKASFNPKDPVSGSPEKMAQISVNQVLNVADIFGMAVSAEIPGGPEFFAEEIARRQLRNVLIAYSQGIGAQALMMAMNGNKGNGKNTTNSSSYGGFQTSNTVSSSKIQGSDVKNLGTPVQGRFPTTPQAPNSVMYRVDSNGNITNYQVWGADGLPAYRVDVTGSAHGGVSTPHVVEFGRDISPSGQVFVSNPSFPRPAMPWEIP